MYLLDTSILSQLVRKLPNPHLLEKLRQHSAHTLFTSCICVMELRHGAVRRRNHGTLWRRIEREILEPQGAHRRHQQRRAFPANS